MIHKLLVVSAILMFGVSAAAAQSCQDTINQRQTLMKRSADLAKSGSAMIKGETPFDLAKTKEIFAAFAEDAGAMPKLFPDCSKTGDHTTAAPAIWDKAGRLQGGHRQVRRGHEIGARQHQGPRHIQGQFPDHR